MNYFIKFKVNYCYQVNSMQSIYRLHNIYVHKYIYTYMLYIYIYIYIYISNISIVVTQLISNVDNILY